MTPPVGSSRLADLQPTGDPLAIVYGPGVDDIFIGKDYVERRIDTELWEQLRATGFECVVFISNRNVYFRDAGSRRMVRRRESPRPARPGRMARFRGPLGDAIVSTRASAAPDSGENRPAGAAAASGTGAAHQPSLIRDPFKVMTLDHLMRQTDRPTAVIFTQAEESLSYQGAERSLASVMLEWFGLPSSNLCLLVFRRDSLSDVHEFVGRLGRYPKLETFVAASMHGGGQAAIRVQAPDQAELERLLQVMHSRQGFKLEDWRQAGALARAMASVQGELAQRWQFKLKQLTSGDTLSLATMRERKWVKGTATLDISAEERLAQLRGLDSVKAHIERLRWAIEAERRLQADGRVQAAGMNAYHLVFTGNPGTGKTTVAELIGELYREIGVLRYGHTIRAEASDLVAGYVGQTAIETGRAVDRALDGVLFIDEAYRLHQENASGTDFGQEAIDTLLSRMEDDRNRLVVIVAGYTNKMEEFLDSNPGLRSRFPPANRIKFPDYEPADLLAILMDMLAGRGLRWEPPVAEELRQVTQGIYDRRPPNFSNAREMRNLAQEVYHSWAVRTHADISRPVTADDIPAQHRAQAVQPLDQLLGDFDDLVGLAGVKEVIADLAHRLRHRQRLGRGRVIAPHMLFLGPPGTGKTTVARLVGKIFQSLGVLRTDHVEEVSRGDLVGRYIGETAIKTGKVIEQARDGILFIDEAYSLVRSESDGRDFGHEAVDTLVQAMENLRGKFVVIAAGYPGPMEQFVQSNPGLPSRFTVSVPFPDYSGAELGEILRRTCSAEDYVLPPEVLARATEWFEFQREHRPDSFGNARAARGLFEVMEARLAKRLSAEPDDAPGLNLFVLADVPPFGERSARPSAAPADQPMRPRQAYC